MPVPLSSTVVPRWMFVLLLLILITIGVTWLIHVVPPGLNRFFGGSLVVAGVLNMLLYRRLGRQTFDTARTMPAFVARFWERIGNEGAQSLYLGIGIVLALGGLLLLIKSAKG